MQTLEKLITVMQDDLDELNHVNNVRYMQWANDIAKAHWLTKATPEMLKDNIWVVLRHLIEYKSQAFLNDVIKLKTYVISSEGVTSIRVVEMYNSTSNKLLVKSESSYCLLNSNTNRPTKIPSEISELFK